MAKKKQYYVLDEKKKQIIIDKTVSPTPDEREDVIMYGRMGYSVHTKIVRVAKKGNKQLKGTDIEKALKDNKEALAEYQRIKTMKGEGGGFFAARAYAKKEIDKMAKK